ncbi:unnamed protein product [Gadus morhua 'NCC']
MVRADFSLRVRSDEMMAAEEGGQGAGGRKGGKQEPALIFLLEKRKEERKEFSEEERCYFSHEKLLGRDGLLYDEENLIYSSTLSALTDGV